MKKVILFLFILVLINTAYAQHPITGDAIRLVEGCFDTDDGKNYYLKAKLYKEGYANDMVDSCNGNTLTEYYCDDDGTPLETNFNCPDSCKEGACIKSSDYDLSDYPDMFFDGDTFSAYMVFGAIAPTQHILAGIDIITQLQTTDAKTVSNKATVQKIDTSKNILDTDPKIDGNEKYIDMIAIGNPCTNKAIAVLLHTSFPTCEDYDLIPKDKGIIKLIENNGKYQLFVGAWDPLMVQITGRVVANYNEHNLMGYTKCVQGESMVDYKVIDCSPSVIKEMEKLKEEYKEEEIIEKEKSTKPDVIEIPKEQKTIPEIIKEEPKEEVIIEKNECEAIADCNDKKPCTEDLCEGTPKKCNNIKKDGCSLEDSCIPYGTRQNINEAPSYCDTTKAWKSQKVSKAQCMNSYECQTNICVDNKCISPGILQKFINFLSKLF